MKNLREQIDAIYERRNNENRIKNSLGLFYKVVLKRVYENCYSCNLDYSAIEILNCRNDL